MANCPKCKKDALEHTRKGLFTCAECGIEIKVGTKIEIISGEKFLEEKEKSPKKFICTCGSRCAVETYGYLDGVFVLRWNMKLKKPPEIWKQSEGLSILDTACAECGKILKDDLLWSLHAEIESRYGI